MATSSIHQTVLIKDRRKISKFVRALEESKESRAKDVAYSRPVEEITDPEMIRKLFGEEKNDGLQDHHD